jgi:2-polyprenyl-6-methoxyphenol hydroxylase-like FAD-dependent oxidoreductase
VTVSVIGAGIGGLTTALALHAANIPVQVFESVKNVRALGVGINLLPHAVKALSSLGLLDALRSTAIETSELVYYSHRGEKVWQEPRGMNAGYTWPQLSIHRGELQLALLKAAQERLGEDNVRSGHHLLNFDASDDGITAHFVDRATGQSLGSKRSALLVAADGIHSTVRAQLYPNEAPPRWDGVVMWRGVTEGTPFLSGATYLAISDGSRVFLAYPISRSYAARGTALINWSVEARVGAGEPFKREDWNRRCESSVFLPLFADWQYDFINVPDLITRASMIYEYPQVDRDPVERWSFGPVTLLGDAAHPMSPRGSNGASQAILDGFALARAVKNQGSTADAFATYEAERRAAANAIVLANRQFGIIRVLKMAHERNSGPEPIDDAGFQNQLQELMSRYQKLAGFDIETVNTATSN